MRHYGTRAPRLWYLAFFLHLERLTVLRLHLGNVEHHSNYLGVVLCAAPPALSHPVSLLSSYGERIRAAEDGLPVAVVEGSLPVAPSQWTVVLTLARAFPNDDRLTSLRSSLHTSHFTLFYSSDQLLSYCSTIGAISLSFLHRSRSQRAPPIPEA